jgi:hypothetical protein
MHAVPTIEHRAEQAYVGARAAITMATFHVIADRMPAMFGRLAEQGVAPAGAPFFRYRVIDMERELVVEAGIPVGSAVHVDGDLFTEVLPAGRYVTLSHIGHPDELVGVTAGLLHWLPSRDSSGT